MEAQLQVRARGDTFNRRSVAEHKNEIAAGRIDALSPVRLLRPLRHCAHQPQELADAVLEGYLRPVRGSELLPELNKEARSKLLSKRHQGLPVDPTFWPDLEQIQIQRVRNRFCKR